MMSLHVVLAGGGTAGHVEPALNLADALRRHDPTIGITALGTERGLECTLVPDRGYDLALIPAVPMPRTLNADLLALPVRVRASVRAATEVLERTRADVVVGFGGYVALPGYLAARRRHIPLVVHEANAKAGLANRIAARLTHFVAETATGSLPHAESIGLPLRPSIVALNRAERRVEAAEFFGLDPHRPTVLVFGGSQGARSLNAAMTAAAGDFTAAGIQVLHSVGARNELPDVDERAYRAVHYIDRMDLAYAAADLAVCRAGAMTVGELTAVGLPAVYVPLPIGNGEQRLNAEPVVAAGGGLLVDDADLTPGWLATHVIPLMTSPEQLAQASTAAASLGRRDADERLRDMVLRAVASTQSQREERS